MTSWRGRPASSTGSNDGKDWDSSLADTSPDAAALAHADAAAADAHARIGKRHALILTDFDGTLSAYAQRPGDAVILGTAAEGLTSLSADPGVTLGVVSGRRLEDVRGRTHAIAPFVAGLHGLEIEGPGVSYRHPGLDTAAAVVRAVRERAAAALAWCEGLVLEDKVYSLACHVRQVANGDEATRALGEFVALSTPEIRGGFVKLVLASKACEILPAVDWHKGRAVDWIRDAVQAAGHDAITTVYLGDDRTDEDAFAALRPGDLAVGVGPQPPPDLIAWRLDGPASAGRFLQRLAALRTPG